MTYYTGLDVSLRSVSVCILDDRARSNMKRKCLRRLAKS
jgi:hypothetical protein